MLRENRDSFFTGRRLWITFFLIIALGLLIRCHGYQAAPPQSWTADEFAFAWCGMSLLQDGQPTAWSWLDVYGQSSVTFLPDGRHFRMVTPWLDHPPLFALLTGGAALLGGERDYFEVSLRFIRLPSLLLGTLSLALLFLLARELFGNLAAVVSSLIFATDPGLVFLSRLAVSENLIVCMLLAVLLLFLGYHRTGQRKYLYLAALLAGLASLAKITGFFVVLLLALLLFHQRKRRAAVEALVIGSLIGSLYLVYGSLQDATLFWSLLLEHGGRFRTFNFQPEFFFHRNMRFFDPWFIFGWLALVPVVRQLKNDRQKMLLALPLLVYLVTLLGTGAQGHFFAWYTIPFYPFIALAVGLFFVRLLEEPDLTGAALAALFVTLWCYNQVFLDANWSIIAHYLNNGIFRHLTMLLLILMMVPHYLHGRNPSRRTARWAGASTLGLLSFSLLANIYMVLNFPAVYGK